MDTIIHEFPPAPLLQPYIKTYWTGEFNAQGNSLLIQQVLPNGYIELIFHFGNYHCLLYQNNNWEKSPNYTLIGLFTKPYEVRFNEKVTVFGIRFKPEGIYSLFKIPASQFSHSYLDMQNVLSNDFKTFTQMLQESKSANEMIMKTEQFLLRNLQQNDINIYYLNYAAETIRKTFGLLRIDELMQKTYISQRQLEREFKEKIGITPKQYMRISRLNEINRIMKTDSLNRLTTLSYLNGFADQAHFIREFKDFTGTSPLKFLKNRDHFIVNN